MCCAALSAALLHGCVVPVPGEAPLDLELMTPDELRRYTEQVFRRHNRTVTRLMMAEPGRLESEQRAQLDRAERRMNRACAALNEIASQRAAGQDPGFALENRVRRSVVDCEQRSEAVASLLDRFEPDGGRR
jgi:hypothetical protein